MHKQRLLMFLLGFFLPLSGQSAGFSELMQNLKVHPYVKEVKAKARQTRAMGEKKGSWGDPKLGVTAQRVPLNSLSLNEHDRTEMMVSLSQKLSFSGAYGTREDSYRKMAKGQDYSSKNRLRQLRVMTWKTVIERKSLIQQRKILRENLEWIKDMVQVSQKLYSNGTIGQQNLYDLETRKAEVESELVKIKGKLQKNFRQLHYLGDGKFEALNLKSVSWDQLEKLESEGERDYQQKQLKTQIKAADLAIESRRKAVIPDPTLSVGYMRMDNMPKVRDMVGVTVSFPLPFSSTRYAEIDSEVEQKKAAQNQYHNYLKEKESRLQKMADDIQSLSSQLDILRKRSLKFAKSSRDVTAKAYQRGDVTYKELQTSELKLQELKLREQRLWEKWQKMRVDYAYLAGDKLYEN